MLYGEVSPFWRASYACFINSFIVFTSYWSRVRNLCVKAAIRTVIAHRGRMVLLRSSLRGNTFERSAGKVLKASILAREKNLPPSEVLPVTGKRMYRVSVLTSSQIFSISTPDV